MDEEELVRLVARGDRSAFDELYRRTSPWLAVRLRRRRADDELVAEDEVLGATIGDEVGEAVRRLAPELRQVSGNGRDVRAALESAPDIRWDLLLGAGTPACANAAAPGTARSRARPRSARSGRLHGRDRDHGAWRAFRARAAR